MKIEMSGFGGEFTCGSITQKDLWSYMIFNKENIKESPNFEYNGDEYAHWEMNDVYGMYGIDFEGVRLEVSFDEKTETLVLDNSQILNVGISNPYVTDFTKPETLGYFSVGILEKKMWGEINLRDDITLEDLETKYKVCLTVNLDVTLGSYEIINKILLIGEKEVKEIYEELMSIWTEDGKKDLVEINYKPEDFLDTKQMIYELGGLVVENNQFDILDKYSVGEIEIDGGRHVESRAWLITADGTFI